MEKQALIGKIIRIAKDEYSLGCTIKQVPNPDIDALACVFTDPLTEKTWSIVLGESDYDHPSIVDDFVSSVAEVINLTDEEVMKRFGTLDE